MAAASEPSAQPAAPAPQANQDDILRGLEFIGRLTNAGSNTNNNQMMQQIQRLVMVALGHGTPARTIEYTPTSAISSSFGPGSSSETRHAAGTAEDMSTDQLSEYRRYQQQQRVDQQSVQQGAQQSIQQGKMAAYQSSTQLENEQRMPQQRQQQAQQYWSQPQQPQARVLQQSQQPQQQQLHQHHPHKYPQPPQTTFHNANGNVVESMVSVLDSISSS
jgi:hypothetical protein